MKKIRFKRKYLLMISSGEKDLEARVNYPSLRKIKVGDVVDFFWENISVIVKIIAIRRYNDFSEMINNENPNRLVPGMSGKDALREYQKIYSQKKVSENKGVIVFEVEVLKK